MRMGMFWLLLGWAMILPLAAQEWTPTTWNGESAWQATSPTGWVAVVSEKRARLVSLYWGKRGQNLLFAPKSASPSRGGHRFWLGPQTHWKVLWPPPADWEDRPAHHLVAEGAILRVKMPREDRAYPAIQRTYEWRSDGLHCAAQWQANGLHPIHIVQLPGDAVVTAQTGRGWFLSPDYVQLALAQRPGSIVRGILPPGLARFEGGKVTLYRTGTEEKFGVRPQAIQAIVGDQVLTMRRGRIVGQQANGPLPDLGYLSQIYLGDDRYPIVEMEQLFPALEGGLVSSEIILEPGRKPVTTAPAKSPSGSQKPNS